MVEQAGRRGRRKGAIEQVGEQGEGGVAQPGEFIERGVENREVVGEGDGEDDDAGERALNRGDAEDEGGAPEEKHAGSRFGALRGLEFDVDRGHGT